VVTNEIERGNAVVIAGDSFAIDDAGAGAQAGERLDDQRKAAREVIAGTAIEPHLPVALAGDDTGCVVASPDPSIRQRRVGALTYPRSIRKQCVDMAPRSWELIALSLLAGIGFGLALDRGDTIFVGVFGAACAMAIIGGMQRFP
jgi:hypothetical protein